MKRINKYDVIKAAVFLFMFIFVFSLAYYNESTNQTIKLYSMGENQNTYQVVFKSDMKEQDMFEVITQTLNKYPANMYLYSVKNKDDKKEIIQHIYLNDASFFYDDVTLLKGRFLSEKENKSDLYVSSVESDDQNLVGVMDVFADDTDVTIKFFTDNEIKSGFFNHYFKLTLVNDDEYQLLKNELEFAGISVIETDTSFESYSNSLIIIAAFVIIAAVCISICLYELLNSYKRIGVQKLMGIPDHEIYLKWIGKVCITACSAAVISMTILSVFYFNHFEVLYFKFAVKVLRYYLIALIMLLTVVSLPCFYIRKIHPSEMLKNKKPVSAINAMNLIFKTIVAAVAVVLLVISVSNYNNIRTYYSDNYKKWENTKDYYVISRWSTSYYTDPWDDEVKKAAYESYLYFNQRGALIADFDEYTEENLELNMPYNENKIYLAANATINPNYLKQNTILDENNNPVEIEENEENYILLVPEQYKPVQQEILEWFGSRFEREPKIIWIKDEQDAFTYRIDIGTDNFNCVKNAIFLVLTTGNITLENWYYQGKYTGDPIKIKGEPGLEIQQEEVLEKLYNYYDKGKSTLEISNVYESVAAQIDETVSNTRWMLIVCFGLCIVLISIIAQNQYLFFEENSQRIVVKHLLGINILKRYKGYFINTAISWLAVLFIALIANVSVAAFLITCLCCTVEIAAGVIYIRIFELKKIVNVIKNK